MTGGRSLSDRIILDADALRIRIVNILENNTTIVVATGSCNRVSARTVDYVSSDLDIGFFTWKGTGKITDLEKNNNTGLCLNSLQAEGKAQMTQICDNAAFEARYQEKLPDLYKKFTHIPETAFIIVKPFLFTLMAHEGSDLFLDHLYIRENYAFRTHLSPW